MKIRLLAILFFGIMAGLFSGAALGQFSKLNPVMNPSLEELRGEFQKGPNRDYSTGPLWTWNDLLTETQIRETLQDMAGQKVKQVWVHPRPGLMTPYLSDSWFDMWKISLDEAKKLDMNVWIYDENSYPSGFAGGFVPEALPDSRGMGLRFQDVDKLDRIDDKNIWYIYRESGPGKYENITEEAKKNGSLPVLDNGRKYLLARVQYTPEGGWFGGKWYVDLLKKGVTEKFIEITFDAYKNNPEIAKEFGNRVPGIFTDEPHPSGPYVGTWVSWNEEIPELFEKKFGYSLIENAPSLYKPVGDWKKVRHNYHALILELFIDRWAKPCFEWCEANKLEFTGHYWEHGWPGTSHGPDNMAMYLWHQRPAIDCLMNQYSEGVNSQFGNVRMVKELSSVANQSGRARTLCELYGAGGWDLRFEDMKRQADWINVLGVNTINEHLSYVTIRGARKRDHPQSFSYHAPWWEGYHVMAEYDTRLQYMLSQGREVSNLLIIEPTTTAWMYQGDAKLGEIGHRFQEFITNLSKLNTEYDLGSEDIIARLGSVNDGKFVIGNAAYSAVVLPKGMENLESSTLELLVKAKQNGVRVGCLDTIMYIDGKTPTEAQEKQLEIIYGSPGKKISQGIPHDFSPDFLVLWKADFYDDADEKAKARREEIRRGGIPNSAPVTSEVVIYIPDVMKVFHHRRQLEDCDILFFSNVDMEANSEDYLVFSTRTHLELWDLDTGKSSPYPYQTTDVYGKQQIKFRFNLPPCGSMLFVLTDEESKPFKAVEKTEAVFKPLASPKIERLEPNVLTLDYVDITAKGETRKDVYYYKVNSWVFQKNGFRNNPWDNQVQFKDELISYEFPKESGFTLTYKFTVKESLPDSLKFVVERPDLYTITCNGEPVSQDDGAWWLDKSFGVLNIRPIAKVGENEIVLTASPMSMWHEIEPAYVIGDFSLESAEKGYTIAPTKPLKLRTPEPEKPITTHSGDLEKVSWLSKGIGFQDEDVKNGDANPYLVFDLGEPQELTKIDIWNYSERNLTKRGVNEMNIFVSPASEPDGSKRISIGSIKLSEGSATGPQFHVWEVYRPLRFQYIIFEIKSNHNGITYPVSETELNWVKNRDNGFVGLSEVRFYDKEGKEIENVKIATKSSELVQATHDRKADYILDGSGLETYVPQQGWNSQGMPFYASGVAYTQKFTLAAKNAEGKYSVRLPNSGKGWYGSTAKVTVNGQTCGYIVSNPWTVDVTDAVKAGENEITVTVIGTLKNTLGPHHAGRVRGSAWPGSFHPGPDVQPPGDAYDTIGYGLFEPFELVVKE